MASADPGDHNSSKAELHHPGVALAAPRRRAGDLRFPAVVVAAGEP